MTLTALPSVPAVRIRTLNEWPKDISKPFVLYWMTAFRRTRTNFALQRAVELAEQLRKPLVILEAVRCNYRWANDRFHRFILDGMIDNEADTRKTNAMYCERRLPLLLSSSTVSTHRSTLELLRCIGG